MSLKISRILHAGYVFECNGTQIAFDPVFENPFSRNCHAFPNVKFHHDEIKNLKLDAVFISHYHDDHCSLESLNYLDRKTPIYMFCVFEEMFSLIRELGFQNVHSLKLNETLKIGSIDVTPRRALDEDVDSIFHIQAEGINVLNVVDSWIDYETLNLLVKGNSWDLVLWPFQTMREIEVLSPSRFPSASLTLPPEWLEQIKALKPKYIVPSSCQFSMEPWSWYNQAFFPITYKEFQKEMETILPESQVIRLNPSMSIRLDQNSLSTSKNLSWVEPLGEQDVDYKYDGNLKPPTTAEVARHFEPLTEEQTAFVLKYCEEGLIEKYKSMEPPLDSYFEKTRNWCLSLYDHNGVQTSFYYRLQGNEITRLASMTEPLSWFTEVPVAKVYAALELGESLTSMYIRINDRVFDPVIEKEIQDADIVEDPLIRSLFNGVFGSYQKAQLKKIKSQSR
nr:MBL fold metallo-hydrolase [uncultured Bdellovibrio sp.]